LTTFYAKQTQFAGYSNERKCCCNKVLCQYTPSQTRAKQTQYKPNTNPIKPNLLNAQMNVNKVLTKDYENKSNSTLNENKPNQTQFPKSQNELKLLFEKGL